MRGLSGCLLMLVGLCLVAGFLGMLLNVLGVF